MGKMVAANLVAGFPELDGAWLVKSSPLCATEAQRKLASTAVNATAWTPPRGIKREFESIDSTYGGDVVDDCFMECQFEHKRKPVERRKSVRFADELNSALECVYPIPVKEETWPYGSLSGDIFPKAFPEFDHLYGEGKAKGIGHSDFNCSLFMPSSGAPVDPDRTGSDLDADLACFDDIRSCVGLSFLMIDGSIARGVCATSRGLWGKKFVRFETLAEKGYVSEAALPGLRPADYLETDIYTAIERGNVASVCRIICVDSDLPTSAPAHGTLDVLAASEPKHNGKKLKTFFYSWYCCTDKRTMHPYLADGTRRVSVFWPADRSWYEGTLDVNVSDGLHRVVYDIDGSTELVNLLQLREQGCLQFLE